MTETKDTKVIQIHINKHFKELLGQRGEHKTKLHSGIWEEWGSMQDLEDEITKEEVKTGIKGLA